MKRVILGIAAAASVLVPLAAATQADAQPRRDDRREWRDDRGRRDNDWNRGRDRWDDNRRWNDNRGRRDNDWNRGRDRWDSSRYNGYYLGNRWYYGQPQVSYYDRYDYRPGYRAWQRGQYLPPAYRGYVVNDYYNYRLRPPPRGYHWVRYNNDYILAAIATGLILEVFSNNW